MASVSDVLQHETNPKGETAYMVEFLSQGRNCSGLSGFVPFM